MRILHTSDWHLGQLFYGKSREQEQAHFLCWLVEQVKAHQIDAVVVAGDLFDTGTPPSYARALYNRFVDQLTQTGCQLVLLAGNHDSVAVLNESQSLLNRLGASIIAGSGDNLSQRLLELTDHTGQVGAILCAIPFLRARDLVTSQSGQSSQDKQRELQQAIADHYQSLYQLAKERAEALTADQPEPAIIMTGHLTALGASVSDSVREIYIGTLEGFPADLFPAADYIALGHIHRSQKVAKRDNIRYSGSPIALSFDEARQSKSVLLVELTKEQPAEVTPLEVPCFQAMARITGNLAQIERQLEQVVQEFLDSGVECEEGGEEGNNHITRQNDSSPVDSHIKQLQAETLWLDIEVDSQEFLSDLQPRIEAMCQDKPVEVLRIRRQRQLRKMQSTESDKLQLHELSVSDVFQRRLELEDWHREEVLDEGQKEEQTGRKQRLESCFQQVLDTLSNPIE